MPEMQEETMKKLLKLMSVAAAGTLAFALIASSASAQTAPSQPTTTAPAPAQKKPTSATPQMIEEAIQRSQARSAKATATGKPEQWGSEEPFTYVPGKTF
jgi:hypothetical protein